MMFINFSKNIVTVILISLFGLFIAGCSKTAKPAEVMSVENIAIDGYDPVAYFVSSSAYKADGTYQYVYKDLTWYFSSDENLQTFSADPESYVPKFGGFCAYELADEDLVNSDPQFWHIHNKGLYLFNDEDAKEDWFREIDVMLISADKEWARLNTPEEVAE
jgi:YHS domain-containing protein